MSRAASLLMQNFFHADFTQNINLPGFSSELCLYKNSFDFMRHHALLPLVPRQTIWGKKANRFGRETEGSDIQSFQKSFPELLLT